MIQKNYLGFTNVTKTNRVLMKNSWILFLTLFVCVGCKKSSFQISKINSKSIEINAQSEQDSSIIKEFLPYKDKMTEEISKVLSFAPYTMDRTDGILQSTLGNLIADLCYEKANALFIKETGNKVDFLMSNYGGIRAAIIKGDVTVSNAFELMPFDNTLVVVELTSKKVEALFNYFIEKNIAHPLSKQIELVLTKNTYKLRINGKPLQKDKTYFVATSNYLQKGGDGMNFFADPVSLYDSNFLIRNAIVEYFKSKDTLRSQLDHRVLVN